MSLPGWSWALLVFEWSFKRCIECCHVVHTDGWTRYTITGKQRDGFQIIWPQHDKTKWYVRPAKTQISLGIRTVWAESSLSTWRNLESLAIHLVHSEDSDQMGGCTDWSESLLGAQVMLYTQTAEPAILFLEKSEKSVSDYSSIKLNEGQENSCL